MLSSVSGEPVCADFGVGPTKSMMQGGLKHPVQLVVREDKTPLAKAMITGLRTPTSAPTHVVLPDDNTDVIVEWAQCPNEHAPLPVDTTPNKHIAKMGNAYECGEAKVYKTETVQLKRGDKASHALTFAPPPDATCWQ